MEYLKSDFIALSSEEMHKLKSFRSFISEKDKEGEVLLLYRGEEQRNVNRRLFSDQSDFVSGKMYERAFYFGEKARHFFIDRFDVDRSFLTGINDCSEETLGFIFDRISNVLNSPERRSRVQENTSEKFREFFGTPSNKRMFVERINDTDNSQSKLNARDYYLYWLHIAGSPGIRTETPLVSTSVDRKVAREFSKVERNPKEKFIFHYFIPKPFHAHAIAPWVSEHHQRIVTGCGLPTYKSLGLYPRQREVAVKGALFPHFIIGIELVSEKRFVVNSQLFNVDFADFEQVSRQGFPIDQRDFSERVFNTGYIRWGQTDLEGNFAQSDV
ncbi:hypothetical protein [Vibrio variabilis]|uniref:hypothetical protein n=1 Tax=Vibrio variabilis TaxID=990271 RepID=UPI000DD9ABED|nr:hypothetical protein [Vibrio variabilis]